ncbi:MAG: beta-ketoacyl synthase [Proteobacteria bacterium]|nr:beta-ketoacyl synthase [Pseudomonadota bacterium]MBU1716723.1 beta-ketoacyl synthase [Pseudomonadota bacterium]
MNEVVIAAAVAVTALGDLDQTWHGLQNGRSALAVDQLSGPLAKWPVGAVAGLKAPVGSGARLQQLIGLICEYLPDLPAETGLVVSTTKGAPDELLDDGTGPWPGQPWELGWLISGKLGLKGPVSTVSAACASGTLAVIDAAQRVRYEDGAGSFLVFGIDLLSNFVVSGFARLHALAKDKCRPFDQNREGLVLGEGGGALLVTSRAEARRRNWPILAVVASWGVSGDAGHITAPCREASGLLRALACCTDYGRHPVGAINAHGTGTRFNDAMEIKAFREMFPPLVPFHSIKGAIGHCLGAAGVIELAVAIKSLAAGKIPPTVGLAEPDQALGNRAGDRMFDLVHPSIISCNSGFGGINAAVLLNKTGKE